MKIEHLKDIIEVANCGSINKAAANLDIAQPALSLIIATVEKELGFPIFQRFNRGVTLTTQGDKVISDARNIVNMYFNWKSLSENEMEINDCVKIAAPWICCALFLPRNILRLRKLYPNISVTTFEMTPHCIIDQIVSGANQFSVGLIFQSAMEYAHTMEVLGGPKVAWSADLLYQDEDVLVLSHNNPYYNHEDLTKDMLSGMTVVKYSTPNRPAIDIASMGFKNILEAGSPEQLLALVAGSDLVTLLPASWMHSNFLVKPDGIRFVYLDEIEGLENIKQNRGTYVIYKSFNRLSPAEKIVLKEIKSNFSPIRDDLEC
jgi:DNA-binding transcriptional LysR family regulator